MVGISFVGGYLTGSAQEKLDCRDDLVGMALAKLPAPSEYKKHDICYTLNGSVRCTVAWLNEDTIISDGQVLAFQPDGTWFYQDMVLQVSECVRDCETKDEGD